MSQHCQQTGLRLSSDIQVAHLHPFQIVIGFIHIPLALRMLVRDPLWPLKMSPRVESLDNS
jgi:hypothetical protein